MPLVSVIIPSYNAEQNIAECVNSILKQSYKNIEIIVVDDGSTDKTGLIARAFAENNSCVTVIHQKNRGVSAARNQGIKKATGELLCFVDSDDTLPEESITALVKNMQEHGVDAVFGNYSYMYNGKIFSRKERIFSKNYTIQEIKSQLIDDGTLSGITFGSACASLYKLELVRDNSIAFNENLKVNEDGVFNVEYCLSVSKIRYISDVVYNYRQWKNKKIPNIDELKNNLNNANKALKEICYTSSEGKDIFERQFKSRKLFCVFQISVSAAALSKSCAIKVFRSVWKEKEISSADKILNYNSMGWSKKFLWNLICKKKYYCFYVMLHYVYPVLRKYIKR